MISPRNLAEICLGGAPVSEIQEGEDGGLFFEEWDDNSSTEGNSDTEMGTAADSNSSEDDGDDDNNEEDEQDEDEQGDGVSTRGLVARYCAPREISLSSDINGAYFILSDEEV